MKNISNASVIAIGMGTLLNLIWEILHAPLYNFAYGGEVTFDKLLISTFGDGVYVAFVLCYIVPKILKGKNIWLVIPIGIVFASIWELSMLNFGIWVYGSQMPLIPIIDVGLTPALQLGITSFFTVLLEQKLKARTGDNKQ